MKTRAELKAEAKAALKGNWGWAILTMVLPLLIAGIIYSIVVSIIAHGSASFDTYGEPTLSPGGIFGMIISYLILLLVIIGFSISIFKASLDLIRHRKQPVMDTIKYGFSGKPFGKFFVTNFIMGIFIYLWSLLLVIPGWIKSMSYSQSNFILFDNLQAGIEEKATAPITKSRHLMDGHKWEYFVLQLSFLGWAILAALTFGIGFLWLQPYIMTTNAAYYDNLLQENGISSITKEPEVGPQPSKIIEEKEAIISDIPLMGQPEVNDAIMK